MTIHKVRYEGGDQTLRFVPLDDDARAVYVSSGATYSIEDLREGDTSSGRTIASGNVTYGGLSSAIASAAGPAQNDDRQIEVADVTSFVVGAKYQINGLGGSEVFVLEHKDSTNNYLYTRSPLRGDYAVTTSAVRSIELECTFPTAEASNESAFDDKGGPYVVKWTYTANGKTYTVSEVIFVVRYDYTPIIDETMVLAAWPGIALRTGRAFNVQEALHVATQDFFADLEAAGKDPAYFKTSRAGQIAVRDKAVEYLLRWQQTENDAEAADKFEEKYQSRINDILNGVPPKDTVEIHPTDDDAQAGSTNMQSFSLMKRS